MEKKMKIDGRALGFVVYMEPNEYKESIEENRAIHIRNSKESFRIRIIEYFMEEFDNEPICIVIGHEHGDDKGKCHYQCFVKFQRRLHRTLQPTALDVEGERLLVIFQNARRPDALKQYCKKGNDFLEWPVDRMDTKSVWDAIIKDRDSEASTVVERLALADPKSLLLYGDRIIKNYNSIVKTDDIPEFEWCFPAHLDQMVSSQETDPQVRFKIECIRQWFESNCAVECIRRQALFMISEERGIGKTYFAKNLVNHEAYYVYCRGSLDASEFMRKEKTAKLIILDDVSYVGNDKEMWKALISGEGCQINTKFYNYPWRGGVPCIVLTNEISVASYWLSSEMFRTQCVFLNIDFYLGVEGTRPSFLGKVTNYFDSAFNEKLIDYGTSRKMANLNKFNK
jgi:hypothetical protein